MARERRAIYRVVGGGGGWLRDWSKRLVAGADKKLHPKKVSPSPPASPLVPPRASPTPARFFSFFPRSDVVTLSFHLVPLSQTPLPPSPNSSTARQASQTSGIHYSCRPTPLDGGTLKIVRKQIRPAPTPPLALHLALPTGVSTRRRASYAIARNDARLIGTTRDTFFLFSFLPLLSLLFSLSSAIVRAIVPKSAESLIRVVYTQAGKVGRSREASLDRFNRGLVRREGWREDTIGEIRGGLVCVRGVCVKRWRGFA